MRSVLRVRAAGRPLEGSLEASPSKSYTHRAFLLVLVAPRVSVSGPLLSGDTLATLSAVEVLGGRVVRRDDAGGLMELESAEPGAAPRRVDCQNSGTTLRLAVPLAATLEGRTVFTGDASLLRRPMGPLVEAVSRLGARHAACRGSEGRPPVEVEGPFSGRGVTLAGDVSSQFLSGLLFAGARGSGRLTVRLSSPLLSRPYVEITRVVLQDAGVRSNLGEDEAWVEPASVRAEAHVSVPGDFSSAAFPLAAAAVTGGAVRIAGLAPDPYQADAAILEILGEMGCRVVQNSDSVRVEAPERLEAVERDLGDSPDLVPIVAVLGASARGATRIRGVAHARWKESDRIGLTARNLRALGLRVEEHEDGLTVHGGPRRGAAVETQGDHRQVMAFAVAGLAAEGETRIPDGGAFTVSYPGFLEDLARLGTSVVLEEAAG